MRFRAIALAGLLLSVSLTGCAPSVAPVTAEAAEACERAAEGITVETDFTFAGNIRLDDVPLSGVHITVRNADFSGETCSDADGKWRMFLPDASSFEVILDGGTLPKGITIQSTPQVISVVDGDVRIEAEPGLTGAKTINLFFTKD